MVEDASKKVTIKEIMAYGFSREEAENIYNGKNPDGSDSLLKLKCRGKQINNKREVGQSYLSFFLYEICLNSFSIYSTEYKFFRQFYYLLDYH